MVQMSETTGKPELRMSRTFDAPLHLVWEAWSRAEYLARWFTPQPGTSEDVIVELRTGGTFMLTMRFPESSGVGSHTVRAKFTEVVPNERIVFETKVHGLDVRTVIAFREESGKTTLDVLQQYSGENEATRGAHAGWTSSLDNLAHVLKSVLARAS